MFSNITKKVFLSVFVSILSLSVAMSVFALDDISRVSLAYDGSEGDNYSFNSAEAVSADGRYVVFSSLASNLVVGDSNSNFDVFRYDTQTGDVELVSVNSSEVQDATGYSSFASISDDGRYVVFRSSADDLVSPQTATGIFHIYLRDITLGTTTLVSVDALGNEGDDDSLVPTISDDGSTIAFISESSNLVAGDANAVYDIYVRERDDAATIERASVDALGGDSNGGSYIPDLSQDGRYVVFMSLATDLDAGCLGAAQVYVRDTITDTTNCVSVVGSTVQTEASAGSNNQSSISADGRYVVFETDASNLDTACGNSDTNIFIRDTVAETTTCVSVDANGVEGNGPSWYPTISANGEYVTYISTATNLVDGDTNSQDDIFVYEVASGETTRASVDASGAEADNDSTVSDSFVSMTENGDYVVFASHATNLVTGDTNSDSDVFMAPIDLGSTGSASSSRGVSRMRLFGYLNSKKAQLPACVDTLPDCIRTIQSFLISNGFGVGMPIDGIKGPLTIGALTSWFTVNK